jgi:hypothetical protein
MITCPTCRSTHARACGSRVFASVCCPVCLETSEPVVALPCGHALCEPCFGRLPGGALLVDGTASGSSTATATATLQWRESMAVGDVIDAKDSEGRWFDSRIVAIEGDRVKVHYNGWSSRWDSWVDRNDESIQPHLTHTDDWRRLRVGDVLEIRGPGEKALWYKGFVKEVDGSRVLVSSHTPNVDKQWLETSSEQICKLGTHVRDKPFVRRRARDASESEEVPNPPRDPRNVAAAVEPVPFVLVTDEKNPEQDTRTVDEIHAGSSPRPRPATPRRNNN